MLPKRLQSIFDFVDEGSTTLDVGCDHALLSIALAKENKVIFAYASDLRASALAMAKKNIIKYNVSNKVIPLLADGLKVDVYSKIDTIIISGLGSLTIIDILRYQKVLAPTLIICANNNYNLLRDYLTKKGYLIDKEITIFENNKFYTTIKFIRGEKKYSKRKIYLGDNIIDKKTFLLYKKEMSLGYLKLAKKIPLRNLKKKIHYYRLYLLFF